MLTRLTLRRALKQAEKEAAQSDADRIEAWKALARTTGAKVQVFVDGHEVARCTVGDIIETRNGCDNPHEIRLGEFTVRVTV
jgi:hypothetical protein